MKITLEINSGDPSYCSKICRTYRCVCGCQDIRVADGFEIVKCPDCGKKMGPIIFVVEYIGSIVILYCRPLIVNIKGLEIPDIIGSIFSNIRT